MAKRKASIASRIFDMLGDASPELVNEVLTQLRERFGLNKPQRTRKKAAACVKGNGTPTLTSTEYNNNVSNHV